MSQTVSFPNFYGYPNTVFQACSVALAYFSTLLSENPTPASVIAPSAIILQTFLNGMEAIAAWQISQAWQTELVLLNEIQVLPLDLNPTLQSYLQNRVACLTSAIPAIQAILPNVNPSAALTNIKASSPAVASTGLLTFFSTFDFETEQAGYVASQTPQALAAAVTAWTSIANDVLTYQGEADLTQAFDEAVRITVSLSELSNLQASNSDAFGAFAASTNNNLSWNLLITLPSLLITADSISGTPYSNTNQQCAVMRFVLGTAATAVAQLLLVLRQLNFGEANLGVLLQGDTLMDLAARTLGNFEQWQAILDLNGLSPPWTGAGGAAQAGQKLLIPTITGQPPAAGLPLPSYSENVLGVDWYLGPLDQPMPVWSGDVPLISGTNNLSLSLARRLVTEVNTYLYDNNFGSRIPPEVGAVQTQAEAGLLVAYGKSAILADNRVQTVLNATAILNANGFGIGSFSATVLPVGAGSNSDSANVSVLAPL